MPRREKSQAGSRIGAIVRDQHRRRYGATFEKETMHRVGPLQPLFMAPWLPDWKYFHPVPDEPTRVWIDYLQAEQDVLESQAEYRSRMRQAALQMYKSEAPRMLKNPPAELVQVVGPPPSPVEPIQAAMSGNKWILGFVREMPSWAAALEIFQTKVEEPLRRMRRRFPDAADERGEIPGVPADLAPEATDEGLSYAELEEERRREVAIRRIQESMNDTEDDALLEEFDDDPDNAPPGLDMEQLDELADGMEDAGLVASVVVADGEPDQDPAVVNESWGQNTTPQGKRTRARRAE